MVIPALPETRMSKRLRNSEVCADCSSSDPRWASVNRGVLICDECCGVHRSLGRHNSQVRHLSNTSWPPTQLQMVQTLYNNGANAIWEHTLLDPSCIMSGKRKANPQDKIHPNKAEFIKAKYQMLAYVHRLPCRDDDSTAAADLSKQLHSSVRTGNLETCLRLLSLGAQANYFHPEKGNTPLHIAAKAGQVCQAELLCVYGADPGAPDSNGKTPINYARQAGHQDLADRLVEVQYELTDRLAFYLCGRKPDHKSGQHFIIPQMADRYSLELSEFAKAAKRKLQSLSDHLFEELAMDVYDEVDRRETDAVWLATQNHSTLVTETTVVPFLPVNPEYSSTRNQASKKLARFNAHEFATLVIDILSDAKRRQLGNSVSSPKDNVDVFFKSVGSRHGSESQEIDQPDYDSVASDEDTDSDLRIGKADRAKSLDSDLSDGPISVQEFLEVKNALSASEAKIQELMKANSNLSEELRLMQKKLQSLQSENSSLRRQVSAQQPYQAPGGPDHPNPSSPSSSSSSSSSSALKRHLSARASRPMSMYETGSGLKPFLPKGETPYPEETFPTLQPFPTYTGKGVFVASSSSLPFLPSSPSCLRYESAQRASKFDKQSSVSDGDYDNTVNESDLDDSGFGRRCRLRSSGWMGESGSIPELDDHESEPDPSLPSTEDVIRKTEQITKNIQELLRAAQENKHESGPCEQRESVRRLRHSLGCFSTLVPWADKPPSPMQSLGLRAPHPAHPNNPASCFIPCAERIHVAVNEMAALFPKRPRSETARSSLRLLTSSANRLQNECKKASPLDSSAAVDMQLVTQQVIQCAYDIAKAAKQLVTVTTKENNN
ncbi:ARF GTPase-activating protein GIT2a isoform X1 [Rhinichthys klamathensis goyatoka]|uniref:ARF GTPase-activating protein GIT2a isoform X1 n=1 Tax=Rhinichthys klamathensis goyatoka TaxID=3034132 RepID=UPI0024B62A25|nr:ARF GTPase-activating protein GIT2a isoform X1 [Rhinichthys klamathensis goyatoka]